MKTAGGRDVDDVARLAIFDAEIRRSCSDELEWGSAVKSDNGVPLLVSGLCKTLAWSLPRRKAQLANLMDDSVPCESGIVHNDMDLAIPELCRFFQKFRNILVVQHVSRNGNSLTTFTTDLLRHILSFLYEPFS